MSDKQDVSLKDQEMRNILKDFSSQVLVTAIEDNIIAQYPFLFGDASGFEMRDDGEVVWVTSDAAYPYFNCVLRARFSPRTVDGRVEATLARFGSQPMTWLVGPSTQPNDLGRYLIAHGLEHTKDETGMAADLLGLNEGFQAPDELVIRRVEDVETLGQWLRAVAVSFGYPDGMKDTLFVLYSRLGFGPDRPWRLYVGYMGGQPVGASRLFLASGVAGIYHVATVPEVRRWGIGTAMTLVPLREARRMGYRIGVLRASSMGLGAYRRLGFEVHGTFRFYTRKGGLIRDGGV